MGLLEVCEPEARVLILMGKYLAVPGSSSLGSKKLARWDLPYKLAKTLLIAKRESNYLCVFISMPLHRSE